MIPRRKRILFSNTTFTVLLVFLNLPPIIDCFSSSSPRRLLSSLKFRRSKTSTVKVSSSSNSETAANLPKQGTVKKKKVLVVGGNGRVGGSSARYVHILDEGNVELILGGRSKNSFEQSKSRISNQLVGESLSVPSITFQALDFENSSPSALAEIIKGCDADAVVHTAGPFQQRSKPTLLEASILAGVPYVDVCDEPPLCEAGKKLNELAMNNNVVAVTAAGIWPGASALMAAKAVDEVRKLDNNKQDNNSPVDITMSFFTAGTGNAGATIVSATFLLLCQKALTIANGKVSEKEPWTEAKDIDFKGDQGVKTVRLLDNPDVFTLYNSIPNINSLSSRFATAPGVWNQLFGAMKALVPRDILSNTDLMQGLSLFSLPIIRAVDKLVGATNAMRVDILSTKSGRKCTFVATHDDLEQCVGLATAAFILELMDTDSDSTSIKPGVYYPAELPLGSRERILDRVKRDAIVWSFETS